MSVHREKRLTAPVDPGFSCPSGGTWYSCSESTFVGCCASDPCTSGCPQADLRAGSYIGNYYGQFPNANCTVADSFFTCKGDGLPGHNPFWGCCTANPCGDSPACPSANLLPAYLDLSVETQSYVYQPTGTATASISATVTTTSTSKAISSPEASSQPKKKLSVVPIAAGAGGAVVLVLLCLLVFFCFRKRSRNKARDLDEKRFSELPADQIDRRISELPAAFPKKLKHGSSPPSYAYYSSPQDQSYQEHAELPGNDVPRAELESPVPSPNLHGRVSENPSWGTRGETLNGGKVWGKSSRQAGPNF